MISQQTFEWQGRRIAWSRQGSGPPVVLCHGTPWSSELWAPIARALESTFTVYLWDMPGFGLSSKDPEHAVDLGVQGAAFAALLDHWQLESPQVVAHDYGGAVALRTALLHGAEYSTLCLVDVVAVRPWGSPFFTLVKETPEAFAQLASGVHRGVVESYVAGASYRGLRSDELSMLTDPWLDDRGREAFYRQIAQADEAFTAELEPLFAQLTIPTHLIWGEQDTWIPIDRAHRLREAIPGSTLTVIPECGHLVQLDAPATLATELYRWLSQHA